MAAVLGVTSRRDAAGDRDVSARRFKHLAAYLREYLSSEDNDELLGLIEDDWQGLLPLIVPLTLFRTG